jgi:glycosyltransferase involved in cell wall biosynthesis
MKVLMAFPSRGAFSGGGRTTMRSLVPHLLKHKGIHRLHVCVPQAESGALGDLPLETWPARLGLRGACAWLGRRCRELKPDVLFLTNSHWVNVGSIPTVCTVRNTEPIVRPLRGNPIGHGLRCLLRQYVARRACGKSTRIIAVSEFVRSLLTRQWGISDAKIGVVYHGVEPPLGPERMVRPEAAGDVDEGEFLFAAGDFTAYRGYEDLIVTLANRRRLGMCDRLLLAGGIIPGLASQHRRIMALIHKLELGDRVTLLGHVKPHEIAWCYQHCRAMIMTSRIEACPNVALEALSHGCTVISTDSPPMPEILADQAMYYPAGRCDRLQALLNDLDSMTADERSTRSLSARARVLRHFTWQEAAEGTVRQLRLAVGGD